MPTSLYALNAVHGVNRFLWQEIQSTLGWTSTNYGGLVPITVPAQQPEFNAYTSPYIVYNYAIQGPHDIIKQEQITYAIYSSREEDIRNVINLMDDLFGREDDSARDLNSYTDSQAVDSPLRDFDYKWTKLISASGAQPPIQEGGRMDGLVILRVGFTVSSDGVLRRDGSKFTN